MHLKGIGDLDGNKFKPYFENPDDFESLLLVIEL